MWCFDVDARVERGSNVTSSALKHLALRAPSDDADAASPRGVFENAKMTASSASASGSAYAFSFGDGGKAPPHVVRVGAIKAVFGKFVREGKLTIESKDGVKVFIKGSPAECARVMKTVTTMKSQPTSARETYLRSLTRCAKCAGKCEAMEKKAEEKRAREARAMEEKMMVNAEKKRKRDAVVAERDAAREAKTNDALREIEEKRSRLERAKEELASMRADIEAERESLRKEKESIVQRRRELEDERRLLERAEAEIAERRDAVARAREDVQEETREINAKKAENVKESIQLDAEKHRLERMRQEVTATREDIEREVARRREQIRATRCAQQKAMDEMLRATSPGSFYGKKKKAKIVMDDDDSDSEDGEDEDAAEGDEEDKENDAAEDVRRKQRIERLRQAEIERQRREKAAREEVARTQAEAERKRERARAAQLEQKAERERKKRLEEETFTHHRRKAEQEARMRQRSRENTVPTATKAMWESHLASLESLKTRAEASLGEADFPWPPKHNIAFFSAGDYPSDRKKKVMKATLSWHPDKFEQKYGKLLKPSEAEKIRKRVADLSAQFIEIRQVMNNTASR